MCHIAASPLSRSAPANGVARYSSPVRPARDFGQKLRNAPASRVPWIHDLPVIPAGIGEQEVANNSNHLLWHETGHRFLPCSVPSHKKKGAL